MELMPTVPLGRPETLGESLELWGSKAPQEPGTFSWFIFHFIFLAVLGLCCCAGSLVGVSRGSSLAPGRRLLVAGASLSAKHGLWGVWASGAVAPRLGCSVASGNFSDQGSHPYPLR